MHGMGEMNKRTNHSGRRSNRELIKATQAARGVCRIAGGQLVTVLSADMTWCIDGSARLAKRRHMPEPAGLNSRRPQLRITAGGQFALIACLSAPENGSIWRALRSVLCM